MLSREVIMALIEVIAEQVDPSVKVFYSTPFGDTKDVGTRAFILSRDGIAYIPVFRAVDSMSSFYEAMGRAAYPILEADIGSVVDMTRGLPEPLNHAGVVIEPFSEDPVAIRPAAP